MIIYKPTPNTSPEAACERAVQIATAAHEDVAIEMNGLLVVCYERHYSHVFDAYHTARIAREAALKALVTPQVEEST